MSAPEDRQMAAKAVQMARKGVEINNATIGSPLGELHMNQECAAGKS